LGPSGTDDRVAPPQRHSFGSLTEIRALRMTDADAPLLVTRVRPDQGSDTYVWTLDITSADDANNVLCP